MKFTMKQPIVMILLFAFLMIASIYQAVTTQVWWLLIAVAVLSGIFILLVTKSHYYIDEDFITASTLMNKTIVSTEDVAVLVRKMNGKNNHNSFRIFLLNHQHKAVMSIEAIRCVEAWNRLVEVCPKARTSAE